MTGSWLGGSSYRDQYQNPKNHVSAPKASKNSYTASNKGDKSVDLSMSAHKNPSSHFRIFFSIKKPPIKTTTFATNLPPSAQPQGSSTNLTSARVTSSKIHISRGWTVDTFLWPNKVPSNDSFLQLIINKMTYHRVSPLRLLIISPHLQGCLNILWIGSSALPALGQPCRLFWGSVASTSGTTLPAVSLAPLILHSRDLLGIRCFRSSGSTFHCLLPWLWGRLFLWGICKYLRGWVAAWSHCY